MKTYKEFIREAGDWWHPDPEQDKKLPGKGPQMRARENRGQDTSVQTKPDYSKRLKPGETYMQFAKRKAMGEELEEGMTIKDFKANRQKNKRRAASADAEKRGHVGKEWYNSGRRYSPDEAKRSRANMDDEERRTRHRSAVDPDSENDDDFSANKTKNPKKLRKQKAMGELGEELVNETSLTRVMSKSKKGGMAIMSAQRGDKSKAENKARSKQLERDVRGAGLPGPTKVAGRYTENPGTSQEKKVGEKSHIITPGKKGKRKFKKAIEKLGQKYNQDSVLIQRKPGGSSTLKGTSKTSWPGKGKNVKIGGMKPGRTGEFDTKVKNKTFTVED